MTRRGAVMRVAGVTALSQAVSAGALGVLQIVGPPWNDVVSFGVQVGGTSLTALVVGILYNLVLGRPDFS